MARLSQQTQRNNNPYSTFRLCCTSVRTKEHAQLVGIISLSVFVCLIVVSYSLFGIFAVAYIASGIIIYGFLMESLLRKPHKIALLGYVAFEALQIAFYISLAIYILIPLIYSRDFDWTCEKTTTTTPTPDSNPKLVDDTDTDPDDSNRHKNEECGSKITLVEVFLFLICLILMKSYFTKVMLHLYKFHSWVEQHANDLRASYINNRGVQINIDDNIFPPPPVWSPGLYSSTINPVPSYDEATNIQKPPAIDENSQQNQTEQNGQAENNRST